MSKYTPKNLKAKGEFALQMKEVATQLNLMKLDKKTQGDIVEIAAVPVRNALVSEWLKVDKSGLGGTVNTRIIIKRGKKNPANVYVGPDFTQYKDYVWNILQWGWEIKAGIGKAKRRKNAKVIGFHAGYRFMDKALMRSKSAFLAEGKSAFDLIMKKK